MKSLFLKSILSFAVLSIMLFGCITENDLSNNQDVSGWAVTNQEQLTIPLFPANKEGGVSLAVIAHNITDDLIYQTNYLPLNNKGVKATFYVNLALITYYESNDDALFWKRIKEYIRSGHEIGLFIRNRFLSETKQNDFIDKVLYAVKVFKAKTDYDIVSVKSEPSFQDFPLDYALELEKHGFLINRYNFYRTTYLESVKCPDPEEIGDRAEQEHQLIQFLLYDGTQKDREKAFQYNNDLLNNLSNRNNIAVIPFKEAETRYRNIVNMNYSFVNNKWVVRGLPYNEGISGCVIDSHNAPPQFALQNNDVVNEFRPVRVCAHPNNAKALIVFSVDDVNDEMYTQWYPAFKESGVKASFFVIFGDMFYKKHIKMFQTIQSDGYEIGCHSFAHTLKDNDFVGNLSEDLFEQDIKKAVDVMKNHGFNGESYCFPGNFHTKISRYVTSKYFSFFVTNERVNIATNQLKYTTDSFLDYLIRRNEYCVIMFHTSQSNNEAQIQTFKPLFSAIGKSKEIACLTYSQSRAYREEYLYVKPHVVNSDKNSVHIKMLSDQDLRFTLVPLTIAVSLRPEDFNRTIKVTIDGKEEPFTVSKESETLLFQANPGSDVLISFTK